MHELIHLSYACQCHDVQAKQYLDVEDGEEDGDETLKMADPALGGRYDAEQLRNMAWAAKLCVHSSPHHRPQMSEVLHYTPCAEKSCMHAWSKHHSVFELRSHIGWGHGQIGQSSMTGERRCCQIDEEAGHGQGRREWLAEAGCLCSARALVLVLVLVPSWRRTTVR